MKIQKLNKKILSVVIFFVGVFVSISPSVFAMTMAEAEEYAKGTSGAYASEGVLAECVLESGDVSGDIDQPYDFDCGGYGYECVYFRQFQEYMQFLDTHFSSTDSNSSLTNTAIAKYLQYKKDINSTYAFYEDNIRSLAEKEVNASQEENNYSGRDAYNHNRANYERILSRAYACKDVSDTYVTLAKDRLVEHVARTSSQKQTLLLVEKYSNINSKLQKLNILIAQVYAYYKSFADKLPGYVKKCMKG